MTDGRPTRKPTLLIVLPELNTSEEARRLQVAKLLVALRQESNRMAGALDELGFSLQIEHAKGSLDEQADAVDHRSADAGDPGIGGRFGGRD